MHVCMNKTQVTFLHSFRKEADTANITSGDVSFSKSSKQYGYLNPQFVAAAASAGGEDKKGTKVRKPSLLAALARTFGGYYAVAGVILLCYDLVAFINPQLLR